MADEKKQDHLDDAPTIIGKEAKNIISAAKDISADNEDTQKIDISDLKSQATQKEAPNEKEEYPVQFTKEDILGENWHLLDELDPYTDDEPAPSKKSASSKRKKQRKHISSSKTSKLKSSDSNSASRKNTSAARNNTPELWKKLRFPVVLVLIAFTVVFAILYMLCSASIPTDVIAKNVYIESLNVGGLTYDEALASVKATYLFENQKVTLKCGGQTFEFDGLDIGLSASPEETTKKAFNYTKSDNKFINGVKAVGLLFHCHTVVPVANIDEQKLDDKLMQFGLQVHGELVGHYVEVRDNNEATIWPGHTGFDGDISIAKKEILDAFTQERFTNIAVTLNTAPPSDITVEQYDLAVYTDPIDAYYEVKDNEVNIVPEVNGRYIDKEGVAPLLATVKEGVEPVIVPWNTAYAAITADMLQEKLFNDTLASYSTYYGSSTANRSANVARAAELLNGATINSGEIFSFNTQVGQRTKYNGFYTAPEYANGQTVEGIGGGTCQVSTTLYSAVLYAGLDIISRTNHMFSVSYAPLGQDATVSDTGIDFQFRNNTNYPVRISSYTDGSKIYVDVIGTAWEPERTVKLDHSVSYGSGGTSVYSKRYIYENDECILDEKLPSSFYKTHE